MGKRVSGSAGADSAHRRNPITNVFSAKPLVSGIVPRFEIPGWSERYGVVAGITGRGSEPGRGFDLGLWSNEPVGDVMGRWLAFRREMATFPAVVLGNQVHGVEVMTCGQERGWVQVEGIDGGSRPNRGFS